jgi:two-component system response regulator AtoC
MKRTVRDVEPEAMRILQRHSWPGNVRELQNVIERAVVLSKGPTITVADLPDSLVCESIVAATGPAHRPMPLRDALAEPEKRIIEAALRANGGNRQLTAEQLGINRTTLYKKMKRYGLAGRE